LHLKGLRNGNWRRFWSRVESLTSRKSGVEHAGVDMPLIETVPALNEAREAIESPSILIVIGSLFT